MNVTNVKDTIITKKIIENTTTNKIFLELLMFLEQINHNFFTTILHSYKTITFTKENNKNITKFMIKLTLNIKKIFLIVKISNLFFE